MKKIRLTESQFMNLVDKCARRVIKEIDSHLSPIGGCSGHYTHNKLGGQVKYGKGTNTLYDKLCGRDRVITDKSDPSYNPYPKYSDEWMEREWEITQRHRMDFTNSTDPEVYNNPWNLGRK